MAVTVAFCLFSSLVGERATVSSPTWWFELQVCPGQMRAPVLMNHAAGNRSPAELHIMGVGHFHKSLIHSAEVLWRSCGLKPSIRGHSIIITAGDSRSCAVQTLPLQSSLSHSFHLLYLYHHLSFFFFSSLLFSNFNTCPYFDHISRTASCLMQSNTHTNVPHNVTDCREIEKWSDGVSGEDKEVCRAQYVDKVMISPSLLPC